MPVDAPLDGYSLIVVPPLPVVPDDFAARLARSRRAGRARSAHRFEDARPADSGESAARCAGLGVAGARVARRIDAAERDRSACVSRTAACERQTATRVTGAISSTAMRRTALDVRARFADGHPAYVRSGAFHYLASLFDERSRCACSSGSRKKPASTTMPLGDSVRISRRGALTYVFNYGDADAHARRCRRRRIRDRFARDRTAGRGRLSVATDALGLQTDSMQ